MDPSHLADDVLRHINNREALIQRLGTLHREASHSRGNRVQRLLYGIHNASLAVVEAIEAWNASKQEDWYRRRNLARHIESHAHESSNGDTCPYNAFIWNEESYLKKMIYDLDFVRDIPEAITLFGSESIFHRNPFLLPYCIDEFVGEADHSSTTPWKDVNLLRICNASFLILLDEFHYKKSTTGIAPMTAAKFLPPNINAQELSVLHGMSYPPAATVVALCCAHLILNTVEADVMNKLVFLTKAIMLRIFRHPLVDLVEKAKSFNPLRR
eukprot:scaffold42791_cov117-Skeletonema_marinoi.AAC.2